MQSTRLKQAGANVAWITGGCLGGIVLGVLVALGLWEGIKSWGNQVIYPGPVPYGVRSLPQREVNKLIDQAQVLLDDGQPEAVSGLLLPNLDRVEQPELRAQVLQLLGDAEMAQGKSRWAASYFRRLCEVDDSGENLNRLGNALYFSGDSCGALRAYQQLLVSKEQDDYPYLENASLRVRELEELLKGFSCESP